MQCAYRAGLGSPKSGVSFKRVGSSRFHYHIFYRFGFMLLDAIIGVPDTLGTSFLPAGKLPPIQKHRDCHHIPMWVSNYGILAVSSHDLFPVSKANPLARTVAMDTPIASSVGLTPARGYKSRKQRPYGFLPEWNRR